MKLTSQIIIFLLLAAMALATSFFIDKCSLSYLLYLVFLLCFSYPFLRSGEKDFLEVIYWMTIYFFISQGARIFVLMIGESPWLDPYPAGSAEYFSLVNRIILYDSLALMSLYLGYYIKWGGEIGKSFPVVELDIQKKTLIIFLFAGLIHKIIFQYYYFKYIASTGVDLLDANAVTQSNIEEGGRGLLSFFGIFFDASFYLALYLFYKNHREWWLKLFILCYIGTIVAGFLIVGSKSAIIYLIIGAMIFRNYLKRRLKSLKILLLMIPLVLLSPLLWYYRAFGLQDLPGLVKNLQLVLTEPYLIIEPFLSRSFGADMFFLIIAKTPQEYPFTYGATFLKALWAWIPRQWWVDKPWSLGVDFNHTYLLHAFQEGASVSPSLIGEFYMNFHVVGIVVGFFLLGLAAKVLYQSCVLNKPNLVGLYLYFSLFQAFVQGLEGPFSDHFVYLQFFRLIPLFVLLIVFKGHRVQHKMAVENQ